MTSDCTAFDIVGALAFGIACGAVLARPELVMDAIMWCRVRLERMLPGGRILIRRETSRPPTPAETSAHRLGVVDGLQEAEGILSDQAAAAIERRKVNPASLYITSELDALELARRRLLERRLIRQHALDHEVEDGDADR